MMSKNEWWFSGIVFSIRELNGEYSASMQIRGSARELGEIYSSKITELKCLLPEHVYLNLKRSGVGLYTKVTVKGHMETFYKDERNSKVMFIADSIEQIVLPRRGI